MRILIASQDWDYRFARPQHLSRIFSEQHQVTYLATGPDIRGRLGDARRGNVRWRPPSYRIAPRLQAFGAFNPVGHSDPSGIRRDCRLNARLARLFFPQSFGMADFGITTNPLHYDMIANLRWRRLVYDCLDRYDGFFPEGSELRSFVVEREERLLGQADFVFASARLLAEEKSRYRKVHYLPHGADVEFFRTQAGLKPEDLADIHGPCVGFVGGIEPWLELSWIAQAAEQLPDVQFVFVGDVRLPVTELPNRPNIRFLGYRPYPRVPGYVAAFDVCVIPFRINHLTAAVNPIKVLEYFSLGKPVVASYMPELEPLLPHLILARSGDEFLAGLKIALAGDSVESRFARERLAAARSWRKIAARFLEVVTGRAETTGF